MNLEEQRNNLMAQIKELNELLAIEKEKQYRIGREDLTSKFIAYEDSLCQKCVAFVCSVNSYNEKYVNCTVNKIYDNNVSILANDFVYYHLYQVVDRDCFMKEYERINREIQSNR